MDYKIDNKINIALLLAAGYSTRFINDTNIAKQLYKYNDKPLICYSIDVMLNIDTINTVIIVTNTKCKNDIQVIVDDYNDYQSKCNKTIRVIVNDINERIESLITGFQYIVENYGNYNNGCIIIHDVARPFITTDYINNLLNQSITYDYNHYCLKMVNGLINLDTCEFVDRNKYIEACTPLSININIIRIVIENHIEDLRKANELFTIVRMITDKYNFVYGEYCYLRKITSFNDLK